VSGCFFERHHRLLTVVVQFAKSVRHKITNIRPYCSSVLQNKESAMPAPNNPFSFSGRLGQKPYWQLIGTILTLRVLAIFALILWPDLTFLSKTDFLLVFVAILVGKRMRDFGVSAIWGWVGVVTISLVLPIVSLIIWPPEDMADILDILPPWVGLVIFGSLLGLITWVGLKKGDPGPNRFGEAPDAAPANGGARVEPRF
jgi:uncharacterized membrane protein YhaH (DUF805 family)